MFSGDDPKNVSFLLFIRCPTKERIISHINQFDAFPREIQFSQITMTQPQLRSETSKVIKRFFDVARRIMKRILKKLQRLRVLQPFEGHSMKLKVIHWTSTARSFFYYMIFLLLCLLLVKLLNHLLFSSFSSCNKLTKKRNSRSS